MVAAAHSNRWNFNTKCILVVLLVLGLLGAGCGIAFALTSQSSDPEPPPEPTWCQWGGAVNNPGYEWAVPRDKERNEWYCNWVQEQATVLQHAAADGSVSISLSNPPIPA